MIKTILTTLAFVSISTISVSAYPTPGVLGVTGSDMYVPMIAGAVLLLTAVVVAVKTNKKSK